MNTFAIISFCILIFVYHKSCRKFFDLFSEELNDLSTLLQIYHLVFLIFTCLRFSNDLYYLRISVKGVKKKTMQKIQRIKTPLAAASYRFLTPKMKRLNRLTSYLSEHVSKRRFTDVKEPDHSINCEVFSPLKFPSGTRIFSGEFIMFLTLKFSLEKALESSKTGT